MRRFVRWLAGAALALSSCDAPPAPVLRASPAEARFVTADIDRFWNAFDALLLEPDAAAQVEILERVYLAPASPGLQRYFDLKIQDARLLRDRVWESRAYYASIRPWTAALDDPALSARLRSSFETLRRLYASARFPDVTFVIGRLSSGGTADWPGLMIGVEMFGRTPTSPLDGIGPLTRTFLKSSEALPGVVAHELIHFQQPKSRDASLLARALREGVADFVGERISGVNINSETYAWAASREAELWREFRGEMDGVDVARWLYNGSDGERPPDLGYFIGYRIASAYYERARDKRRALADVIEIGDARAFLESSAYDPGR